jgi:arginyl-tRNA synthetase
MRGQPSDRDRVRTELAIADAVEEHGKPMHILPHDAAHAVKSTVDWIHNDYYTAENRIASGAGSISKTFRHYLCNLAILQRIMEQIKETIHATCQELFNIDVSAELTRPDEQFGDYSTNVAMQLAGKIGKNPREIADQLAEELRSNLSDVVSDISVAGPGFLNIKLTDSALIEHTLQQHPKSLAGKTIVAEYSDPNPFKVLHAGHLYTSITGDAIANVLEYAGATVHRVNFGGDVGLHVAKNMWAILQWLGGENPDKLSSVPKESKAEWLSDRYVEGNEAYEHDDSARVEIVNFNKRIYQLHDTHDRDSSFAQIYWTCRQWSYDYFDAFYAQIGSSFERYYPESETAPIGLSTVLEQLEKGVYEKSDGAVVFNGERYGLHTRVFINSEGLPTYEAKDVGLIMAKWRDYKFDRSVVITGNDIVEYMKVVLKSIEQFQPDLAQATTHLTHGMVKLQGGQKMSSRKGNVLRATDVLEAAHEANKVVTGNEDNLVTLGAVKYAFLKQRLGGDVIYDPKESVSIHGNSGPYLQYAHARARSILEKSEKTTEQPTSLAAEERSLVRKIDEFKDVIERATEELMPHHICTYLYELAQSFNRFYEHNRVIGSDREPQRLWLVKTYADTLQSGLQILGIHAPENM